MSRPASWGGPSTAATAEKIGLYVAVGTVGLLVLAGIVVGIVALAGGF